LENINNHAHRRVYLCFDCKGKYLEKGNLKFLFWWLCMVAKINVDPEEFKRLHAEGMSDNKIAEALGFSSQTARRIRNEIGLLPQIKLPPRLSKINETEFLKHYQQGKGTKEIASELHVTYGCLYKWMNSHNYTVNSIKCVKARTLLIQQQPRWEERYKDRLELYNKGLSDAQIAAELNEKKSTIMQWRREKNLPLLSKINETEFLKHFQQGKSTKEIASVFQVNHAYLCRWMRKHNYIVKRPRYARKNLSGPEIAAEPGYREKEYRKSKVFVHMTFSFRKNFLDEFNRFMKIGDYSASEAIRVAMRKYVSDYEQTDEIKGQHVGTASIIYNHIKGGHPDALLDLRHEYSHLIKLTMHIHFNSEVCLETVILDGDGEKVKSLAKAINILNGINFSELSTVSLDYLTLT
jgi:CopG family transcriptional regulator, nickel-responsive regulator